MAYIIKSKIGLEGPSLIDLTIIVIGPLNSKSNRINNNINEKTTHLTDYLLNAFGYNKISLTLHSFATKR